MAGNSGRDVLKELSKSKSLCLKNALPKSLGDVSHVGTNPIFLWSGQ